jgi:LmbE family N-acetylglucosaminyl deacetylase
VVVLSPHLDDAVISIGGLLARWVAEGWEVSVATVCTAYPDSPGAVPERYRRLLIYDRRREEDTAALGSLVVRPEWLGLCERAVLLPSLPRPLGVFSLPSPPASRHFRQLPRLTEEVARLAAAPSRPVVVAPLAIGGHVDHVETFLACVLAMKEVGDCARFLFYDDAYAMTGRACRRHFVAAEERWRWWRSPALAGPKAAVMLTAMGAAGRGPAVREFLPEWVSGIRWRTTPQPLGGFEEAKLQAMKLYASQMEALGGYRTFAAMVRRWHRAQNGCERVWTVNMGPEIPESSAQQPRVDAEHV